MKKRKKKKLNIDLKQFLKEIVPMIWKLVNRYYFPYIDRIDVVDECLTIVLTKALKSYNSKKRASFKTYYYWQVRSFLSNKYRYYMTKKRRREEYSIYDDSKYITIRIKGASQKVNLQNLLFSRHEDFKNSY